MSENTEACTYNNLANKWECSDIGMMRAFSEWISSIINGGHAKLSEEVKKTLSWTHSNVSNQLPENPPAKAISLAELSPSTGISEKK